MAHTIVLFRIQYKNRIVPFSASRARVGTTVTTDMESISTEGNSHHQPNWDQKYSDPVPGMMVKRKEGGVGRL